MTGSGSTQATPPDAEHNVGPSGHVRNQIDFIDVAGEGVVGSAPPADRETTDDEGGDLACWAGLVCQGCGGVIADPAHDSQHRAWLAALERG